MKQNKVSHIITTLEVDKLRVNVKRTGQILKTYRQITSSSCDRINDLITRRESLKLDIAGVVQPDCIGLGIFSKEHNDDN